MVRRLPWIGYVLAWTTAAVLWAFATATSYASLGGTFWQLFPLGMYFGASMMGAAGLLGLAVWRLTSWLEWNPGRPRFVVIHFAAMCAYSVAVATAFVWLDLLSMRSGSLWSRVFSPVLPYNMLTGAWLYLSVSGLSYVIRGQQRISDNEAAVSRARLSAQQAQLTALRAQINPHFLFNSLHTVGALMSTDTDLADRALERLGDLLRYALEPGETVLFRREWQFALDYLEFERLRYGDRMQFETHIDEFASSVPVPPLILQPLVENAVRHGVAERPEGGKVRIAAILRHEVLTITISNDAGKNPATSGFGLGLESVRNRLEACWGPRAHMVVTQDPCRYAVALSIPSNLGPS